MVVKHHHTVYAHVMPHPKKTIRQYDNETTTR